MVAKESLGQHEFQVAVGPARVAYLITAGSESGFRRAVAEASTRWAGATEPIVPLRAGGKFEPFWGQVIEFANVDGLVNIDLENGRADAAAARFGLPWVPLADIDRNGAGQFTCHPAAVADPSPVTPWTYADASLDLWAVVAGGTFTDEAAADDRSVGQVLTPTKFPDQLARAQVSGTTAIDRTVAQFGERLASPSPFPSSAIVWVCGKRAFRDCIMYWNCRALRSINFNPLPMLLVPEYEINYWMGFGPQVHSLFQDRPDEFAPDALFSSLHVSHARLAEIAESWGLVKATEEPRTGHRIPPPPPRNPPFTYLVNIDVRGPLIFKRDYGHIQEVPVEVSTGATQIRFDSPVHFHRPGRVKATFSSAFLSRYPRRDRVAHLFDRNSHWGSSGLELFTATMGQYRFVLQIPRIDDVINVVLREAVTDWTLSDKGKIGESIANGEVVTELLTPGLYETIRSLTTRRAKHLFDELKALATGDPEIDLAHVVADIGGRVERRSLSARQIDGVPVAQRTDLLERLATLHWGERGLRISCSQCGVTSFVLLDDVTVDAACPGCRRPQRYEHTTAGPTMFYRLNALIDRASDQGVLPHLLATAALHRLDDTSHVLPGVDLRFPDGSRPEVDLVGVFRGKVVAGEVKTSGEAFDREQLERDFRLSKQLKADVHLIAWIGELPAASLERAEQLAAGHKIELQTLPLDDFRH